MDKSVINSRFIESVNYLVNNKMPQDKAEIVESLGIGATGLSEILNNRMKARTDLITCLCFKYDISPDWILTGKGSIFRDNEISKDPRQVHIPGTVPILSNEDFISIPLIEISVATGCSGYDDPSYLDVTGVIKMSSTMLKNNGQYFCIRVKGENVIPTILDSSYIIARTLDRSEWGRMPNRHVCIISDRDGRACLKRIKNRLSNSGFIVYVSDSVDKLNYPNFNLEEQEINCIFHARWAPSAKIPNPNETYYDKVNQLEDKYGVFENQIKQILRAIKDK